MGSIDDALGWNKLGWPAKIAIAAVLVAAFAGWQYYTKSKDSKEMTARMVTMCGGEAACLAAVEQHAAACFDENYRMGRRSQGVKMEEFVACVNSRSGTQFFESVPAS